MDWDEDHQESNQTDEIKMIEVKGSLQQEDVGNHEKEHRSTHPIKQPQGSVGRNNRHQRQVHRHAVTRPRLNKIKWPIGKVEILSRKVKFYPVSINEPQCLPDHDGVEGNSEID